MKNDPKVWVFSAQKVWVIGYGRVMGYALQFGGIQVGGSLELWVSRDYGLREVWVKGDSTVPPVARNDGSHGPEVCTDASSEHPFAGGSHAAMQSRRGARFEVAHQRGGSYSRRHIS